jgi:hypothetical protein
MIDLNEELFLLAQAAKHYPASDPPHVCTFIRWALKGVGKDKVKLETVKIGGRRYTSRAALARFVARLTSGTDVAVLQPERVAEAHCRTERELDEEGF